MNTTPVALITGGAKRIGADLCRHLHQNGFNVVIHFNHSLDSAKALAVELNRARENSAQLFCADLNDLKQVQALAAFAQAAWGRIDALINNASSFYPTPIAEVNEEQWNDLFNSNLKAPFFLAQALRLSLIQHKGSIINIADIFAERPMPNYPIYSIAKAGNVMLTKALALEFAPDIRVNGIAPGAILWPETTSSDHTTDPNKINRIPLKRLGGTEGIAQAVYFLIKQSAYTTGHILQIDGGRSLT